MADREIVKIDLTHSGKIELEQQISKQMAKLGFGGDISKLDLGFPLPPDWPSDMNDQPTMAQLVVIAQKLKMKIIIGNISLFPQKETD